MNLNVIPRSLLSLALTAALFLSQISPALALETAAEPLETLAETEAAQTVPLETESPETAPPETLPSETLPEETLPAETLPPLTEPAPVLTVSQVLALAPGPEEISLRGTVVWASGSQAVIQDSTGGIRLAFDADPGTVPGEILLVTGNRSSGLVVWDFESLGTGELPWVESTLLDAPDALRVGIRGAVLGVQDLSQQGFSLELVSDSDLPAGMTVDAWGVILNGIFYGDTLLPAQAASSPAVPEKTEEYRHFFGQLHAHTEPQTPGGTAPELFAAAAQQENLDFFAITDHSHSLDNAAFGSLGIDGSLVSTRWAEGKAAAQAASSDRFLAMYAYEISWPEEFTHSRGHISTFGTPGWQTYLQPGFETFGGYFSALETVEGSVSQFNHPSAVYDYHLFDFYDPSWDRKVHLMETGVSYDAAPFDYYTLALDAGWHLAPSCNPGTPEDPDAYRSPVRTVVLAKELTEESLYEAIRSYRVYGTQDRDLVIDYRVNDALLGSILGPSEALTARVEVEDPTDAGGFILEVIADGGEAVHVQKVEGPGVQLEFSLPTGYNYYYLRLTQADGEVALTAPVWVDRYEDMGIQAFAAQPEKPGAGEQATLSLELFNQENVDFILEGIEFSVDGEVIHAVRNPGTVSAMQTLTYRFPYTREEPGTVTITAVVTGKAAGDKRSYSQSLNLTFRAREAELSPIGQVRSGEVGMVYRVSGFLTSGNTNLYNTFSGELYIQDDTGGIALRGSLPQGVAVGTALEATGILRTVDGNPVLSVTDYTLTEEIPYRYTPKVLGMGDAMDYENYGGMLVQIEGTAVSLIKTADGKGISHLTLKDGRGNLGRVRIEENIRSGAYGVNQLAGLIRKGRTVRAVGLVHMDEFGEPVLRVRNCEEVVYVPARVDPTNPRTGDLLARILHVLLGK